MKLIQPHLFLPGILCHTSRPRPSTLCRKISQLREEPDMDFRDIRREDVGELINWRKL